MRSSKFDTLTQAVFTPESLKIMPSNADYRILQQRRRIHDIRLEKQVRSAAMTVVGTALKELRVPSEEFIEVTFLNAMKQELVSTFKDGVFYGLKDAERMYGRELPIKIELAKAITRADVLDLGLGDDFSILAEHGMKQIKTISSTLHSKLRNEFATSLTNNESQTQLISRIQKVQNQVKWRARRIAQTEVTRIYNGGSLLGYQKSTIIQSKKWVSNLMGNPRPWHREAAGQEVAVNAPFIVHGEQLMYPGDPAGSPSNTINCHCGMLPVVRKPVPLKALDTGSGPVPNIYEQMAQFDGCKMTGAGYHLLSELMNKSVRDKSVNYANAGFFLRSNITNEWIAANSGYQDVLRAITDYAGSTYRAVRNTQAQAAGLFEIGGAPAVKKAVASGELSADKLATAQRLQNLAMQRDVEKDIPLHRGIGWWLDTPKEAEKYERFMKALDEDSSFDLDAVTSFTYDIRTAASFADKFDKKVMIHVLDNTDVKGAVVNHFALGDEAEVILAAGQKFNVFRRETINGVLHLHIKKDKAGSVVKRIKGRLTQLMHEELNQPLGISHDRGTVR